MSSHPLFRRSLTVEGCTFDRNLAWGRAEESNGPTLAVARGGAIDWIVSGDVFGRLQVAGSSFDANKSLAGTRSADSISRSRGGAMSVRSRAQARVVVSVEKCVVEDNVSYTRSGGSSSAAGGSFALEANSARIGFGMDDTLHARNAALGTHVGEATDFDVETAGGALAIVSTGGSVLSMQVAGGVFEDNRASIEVDGQECDPHSAGGAVLQRASDGGLIFSGIDQTTFLGNRAAAALNIDDVSLSQDTTASGGAIASEIETENSRILQLFEHCSFRDNVSEARGGRATGKGGALSTEFTTLNYPKPDQVSLLSATHTEFQSNEARATSGVRPPRRAEP